MPFISDLTSSDKIPNRFYMLVLIAVQNDEDEASENEAVDTEDDDE